MAGFCIAACMFLGASVIFLVGAFLCYWAFGIYWDVWQKWRMTKEARRRFIRCLLEVKKESEDAESGN